MEACCHSEMHGSRKLRTGCRAFYFRLFGCCEVRLASIALRGNHFPSLNCSWIAYGSVVMRSGLRISQILAIARRPTLKSSSVSLPSNSTRPHQAFDWKVLTSDWHNRAGFSTSKLLVQKCHSPIPIVPFDLKIEIQAYRS